MHTWKVVPLSPGQLLDVRPDDILNNGLYRRCSTYRGGGGYDKFPAIAARHFGGDEADYSTQFIVQLFGCNLDCSYCYVTRAGVWGDFERVTSDEMVEAFLASGQKVFHLMGGAPALQLPFWQELIATLRSKSPGSVFHSDLMLTERDYGATELSAISKTRCLYAVNIKGLDAEEWLKNTRKPLDETQFWKNWKSVQDAGLPAYVTFTGVSRDRVDSFWEKASKHSIDVSHWQGDSFVIDLIAYEAAPHVDDAPWGAVIQRSQK